MHARCYGRDLIDQKLQCSKYSKYKTVYCKCIVYRSKKLLKYTKITKSMRKKILNHHVGINAWPSYGRYLLYQKVQ